MPRLPGLATACCLLGSVSAPVYADDSIAKFYEDNCSVCHTIGGGEEAGPDLAQVTGRRDRAWLLKVLLDPEGLAASGDAQMEALVKKWDGAVMPRTDGLNEGMAAALLDYIDEQAPRAGAVATLPTAVRDEPFTAAQIQLGRRLYIGEQPLANGGPACLSCHHVNDVSSYRGGTLAPDLTAAHAKLGGRRGLTRWLSSPPTPLMRAVYRHAQLTMDETMGMVAYLEDANARAPAPAARVPVQLMFTGVAGAGLGLVVAGGAWRRRFRAVRRPLVHGRGGEASPPHRSWGQAPQVRVTSASRRGGRS